MQNVAIKTVIGLGILSFSSAQVFAAAMDRSGQSIQAFLQTGNYAELGYSAVSPNVSGQHKNGQNIPDMANRYDFFNAALKLQAAEQFSFGLLYDQPFGGLAEYTGDHPMVEQGSAGFVANTQVDVSSDNLSILIGYQPTKNINLYAGPVYQRVEGTVQFAGPGFKYMSGYSNQIDSSDGYGWLLGAAYEIPEIALKAAVTYRSEIDHKAHTIEHFKFVTLSLIHI